LVITKIEKQKKHSKRWNLYIDGEFACGISEDTFLNFGFRTNDEISQDTLSEVKRFDEYQFSKKSALDFLAYRIRSKKEIVDKLKNKNVSGETIEKTIRHLEKLGLINDEEFAKLLVQSSTGKNPSGKSVIKQKLYKKGISKDIIEKVLSETFTEKNERTFILDIFSKYKKKLAGLDKNHQRKKMFEHLARKGFDFDIINEILNQKLKDESS
jgi:regulatory protein